MNKFALISVSDKSGVVEFARFLLINGYEILSTGGTAKLLSSSGIRVTLVSEYTGHPEILGGRVKTLHPKIHAGILADETLEHSSCLERWGYDHIDIVAVNLYPFKETISKKGVTFSEAIEQIDIGGPTMLRAAAKNCSRVIPICYPEDYHIVFEYIRCDGEVPQEFKKYLATKVFKYTSDYDKSICNYFISLQGNIVI